MAAAAAVLGRVVCQQFLPPLRPGNRSFRCTKFRQISGKISRNQRKRRGKTPGVSLGDREITEEKGVNEPSALVGVSPGAEDSPFSKTPEGGEDPDADLKKREVDRAVNAAIVLAAGFAAITKLLTIDRDYWQVKRHVHKHATNVSYD